MFDNNEARVSIWIIVCVAAIIITAWVCGTVKDIYAPTVPNASKESKDA